LFFILSSLQIQEVLMVLNKIKCLDYSWRSIFQEAIEIYSKEKNSTTCVCI
jgi:hypothetical protein